MKPSQEVRQGVRGRAREKGAGTGALQLGRVKSCVGCARALGVLCPHSTAAPRSLVAFTNPFKVWPRAMAGSAHVRAAKGTVRSTEMPPR